jgi:hypothetical protein
MDGALGFFVLLCVAIGATCFLESKAHPVWVALLTCGPLLLCLAWAHIFLSWLQATFAHEPIATAAPVVPQAPAVRRVPVAVRGRFGSFFALLVSRTHSFL